MTKNIYTITYTSTEGNGKFVGSGIGRNESEALRDFMNYHAGECIDVETIELYE